MMIGGLLVGGLAAAVVHDGRVVWTGAYGLRDYNKLFCPDLDRNDDIFAERGIDREGCIVIVRPDQHVAQILPLDGLDGIGKFFDRFMLPQG